MVYTAFVLDKPVIKGKDKHTYYTGSRCHFQRLSINKLLLEGVTAVSPITLIKHPNVSLTSKLG
jgi:hypothetical protein